MYVLNRRQVMLALDEDQLTENPETIKRTLPLDLTKDGVLNKVTLRELCKVLGIFTTVSTKYVLITVRGTPIFSIPVNEVLT